MSGVWYNKDIIITNRQIQAYKQCNTIHILTFGNNYSNLSTITTRSLDNQSV